jgi:molecular chaperone GrpE
MTNEEKPSEVVEPEMPVEDAEGGEQANLQGLLEDARNKVDEHWNQLLRTQAELENLRRRAERDVENAHKFGLERFAQELLPVKDSLELGLSASTSEDEAVVKLREGMELTLKMLSGAMEKFGIAEVNPVGAPFDPQQHQAMTMQESAEQPPNTVLAVMQKGYLLHDRLIRPAMVVVAKAPAGEPGANVDAKA